MFPSLPSSYRRLKEISPVLTNDFTFSPVNLPKPISPVLPNPRFRPHHGLEKGCYSRRITRRNTNCSEWHALVHVSVNNRTPLPGSFEFLRIGIGGCLGGNFGREFKWKGPIRFLLAGSGSPLEGVHLFLLEYSDRNSSFLFDKPVLCPNN